MIEITCRFGKNEDKGGVPVKFGDTQLEIIRTDPCPGCEWRKPLNFQNNPLLEQVTPKMLENDEIFEAWQKYCREKKIQGQIAKNKGGYFSWEQLHISRYPNINPDGLICTVEPRREK